MVQQPRAILTVLLSLCLFIRLIYFVYIRKYSAEKLGLYKVGVISEKVHKERETMKDREDNAPRPYPASHRTLKRKKSKSQNGAVPVPLQLVSGEDSLVHWLVIVLHGISIVVGTSSGGWNPGGGLPGQGTLLPHLVDLVQGQTLGLWDNEEDEEPGQDHATHEDITVTETNGTSNESGKEGDQEIP